MKIKTSIIIRTFNEERLICRTIRKIQEQLEQNFEIIVVDSESSDRTVEYVKALQNEFSNIKLISLERKRFSFGRSLNIGFEAATGKYCALVSGHSPPVNQFWLSALVRAVKDEPLVAGVFGKQIPFDARQVVTPSDYAAFGDHKKILDGTLQPVSFSNANALIKKNVWEINKFNEYIPGSEDRLWAKEVMAKGLKIVYEPASIVFHSHHNETLVQIRERSCINFSADLHYLKEWKSKFRIIVSAGYAAAKDCVYLLKQRQINLILKMLTVRYTRVKGRLAAYEKTENNPFRHS